MKQKFKKISTTNLQAIVNNMFRCREYSIPKYISIVDNCNKEHTYKWDSETKNYFDMEYSTLDIFDAFNLLQLSMATINILEKEDDKVDSMQ